MRICLWALLMSLVVVAAAFAADYPLVVQHLSGAAVGADDPARAVSWGVPLPRGAAATTAQLRLVNAAGKSVPCQFDPMATWDHGKSVQWVLLSFTLDPKQAAGLKLQVLPQAAAALPATPALQVKQQGEDWLIDTGAVRCSVLKKTGFLDNVRLVRGAQEQPLMGQGESYLVAAGDSYTGRFAAGPAEITVSRQGPQMATIRCESWYEQNGKQLCKVINRFTFYAGSPTVKISQTFLMTESSGKVAFSDIGLRLPLVGECTGRFGADGQALEAGVGAAYLRQDAPEHCLFVGAGGQQEGKRIDGWMVQSSKAGSVAVAVRDAWQNYPLELALSRNDMTIHFWPEHGRTDNLHPVTLANINKLWFVHEGKLLDFAVPETVHTFKAKGTDNDYRYVESAKNANAMGLAKTHDFSLSFGPAGDASASARELARQVDDPLVVSLSGRDMCASGAFADLYPVGDPRFAAIDKCLRDFFVAERNMEAFCESFGKFNWGDSHTSWRWEDLRFDTIYRTWRNTHHGAPRVPWVLWARSADPVFLHYGLRNARHVLDLDYCHYSTPELEKLAYPVGKIPGALNDYKGLVHWHSGSRLFDYNSMTDFALWYSFVSGDDWGFEVAKQWGDSAAQRFTSGFGHREGAGVCDAAQTLYLATWDDRYLNIAHQVADALIKSQLPDGRMPQWENYAPWIERYIRIVAPDGPAPDPARYERTRQCLIRWADAYLVGPADASAAPGHGWAYYNILAAAYNETRDPKYLAEGLGNLQTLAEDVTNEPGKPWSGYWSGGSLWGYVQQRVPYLLAAAARHGKPVTPVYPEFSVSQCSFRLFSGQEQTLKIKLEGEAKEPGKATLLGPDGQIVKEWTIAKGAYEVRDTLPVQPNTKYTVKLEPDTIMTLSPISNLPGEVMLPSASGINCMRGSRLYFMAPAGGNSFTIDVAGRLWPQTLSVYDPAGGLVERRQWSEFDGPKPQKLVIQPKPEQQGKLWCVTQGLAKNMVFKFDPVIPQVFAGPDPARYWDGK